MNVDSQMLIRLVVHRDLKSFLDVLLEFVDVLQLVGGNKGVVHVDPNVYASLQGLDLREEARVVDRFQVTVVGQMFRISFVIGTSGVRQTVNVLLDTLCLVGISVESKSDEPGELDVERLGVGGVDLVEVRSNGVDHLQMHPVVDGNLQ